MFAMNLATLFDIGVMRGGSTMWCSEYYDWFVGAP